jgi:hypothetical protein
VFATAARDKEVRAQAAKTLRIEAIRWDRRNRIRTLSRFGKSCFMNGLSATTPRVRRTAKKLSGRKHSFTIPYIFPGYEFATPDSN